MSRAECAVCGAAGTDPRPCFRRNQLPGEALAKTSEDRLLTCAACGFRWIDPPPDEAALLAAYRATEVDHWGGVADDTAGPRRYDEKLAALTARVPGGRALDVGCFNGELLSRLPPSFERWGIEVSRSAAEAARRRGITVVEASLLDADLPAGHFDLVVCCDVVEHIVDQQALAQRFRRWLAPGGLVALETGDASALMARLMGPRWYYYAMLEHVAFHTPASLDRLMAGVGLRPVVRERRWHEVPPSPLRPLRRAATALGFRAAMGVLGAARRALPLPSRAEWLYTHTPPWHMTRDHLWHVYSE